MIERIRIIVLTITCMCVDTALSHAGVITVDNDIVTNAILNNGTTDINVRFVNASFNTITAGAISPSVDVMPWWEDGAQAGTLANDLTAKINTYETGAGPLADNIRYIIAINRQVNEAWSNIDTISTYENGGQWANGPTVINPDATAPFTGFLYYYAILDTGGSSVPEPSTAIAMGLLGIVGFAGNRRRRRQESVA